jgi:hypothetical protein
MQLMVSFLSLSQVINYSGVVVNAASAGSFGKITLAGFKLQT